MRFGPIAAFITNKTGIELTPEQVETMIRDWIARCRELAPQVKDASDAAVFDLLMQVVRDRQK